jgi:general secretion pathway protein I
MDDARPGPSDERLTPTGDARAVPAWFAPSDVRPVPRGDMTHVHGDEELDGPIGDPGHALARRAIVRERPIKATPPISRKGVDGFTLLEVLIAFAIASIALAVLYQGAVDGLLGSRLAARTDEAVSRARSRLAALCHGAQLTPGEQSGDDGSGYTWRTRVSRAATETIERGNADQPAPPMRADLLAVRVTLSWPGPVRPHQVALESRCLTIGAADRP